MAQALIDRFNKHPFFDGLDFKPGALAGGRLPYNLFAEKTFDGDSTAPIGQHDYEQLICYTFPKADENGYVGFWIDRTSNECRYVNLGGRPSEDYRPFAAQGLHSGQTSLITGKDPQAILDTFLAELAHVSSIKDLSALIQEIRHELPSESPEIAVNIARKASSPPRPAPCPAVP